MSLLVSTMRDTPGWRVERVLGECTAVTVRSRNVGAQVGAGFKSLVGGELKGLTQRLQERRDEAMQRLVAVAYGTAVVLVTADQPVA